jgi:hypothetical protein
MYVNNRIWINTNKNKPINVSVDMGKIARIDSNYYIITIDTGGITTLTLRQGDREKEIKFRNKRVPEPTIFIGTDSLRFTNNEVSATTFKTFKTLIPVLSNFDYECAMSVDSYKMTRITKDKARETVEYNYTTDHPYIYKLSYLTKKAESGDIYYFTDIVLSLYVAGDNVSGFDKKCTSFKVNNVFAIIK